MTYERKRVLAIASGGGHWEQLLLLNHSYGKHKVKYVTTIRELPIRDNIVNYQIINDCNRDNVPRALLAAIEILFLNIKFRPKIVITTGAMPGLLGIIIGRILGAKTIWIDSIANAEEPSLAGRYARKFAHHWFSQWPHIADEYRGEFAGALL